MKKEQSAQKEIKIKHKGSTVTIQEHKVLGGENFTMLSINYPGDVVFVTTKTPIINDTIGLFKHLELVSKAFKARDKKSLGIEWFKSLEGYDSFSQTPDFQTDKPASELVQPVEQISEENGDPPPFDKNDVDAAKCQEQLAESLQTEEFHQLFKLVSEKGLDVNKFKDYLVGLAADKEVADDLLSPARNAFLTNRPAKANGSLGLGFMPEFTGNPANNPTGRTIKLGIKYAKECTCPECNGDGLSVIANRFKSIFNQEIQYNLTEDDVKAMIFAGGLKSLTHYFAREKWNVFINLMIPTPEEVMKSAKTDWMLLDSVCVNAVMMSRMKAFDLPTVCEVCIGSGTVLSY